MPEAFESVIKYIYTGKKTFVINFSLIFIIMPQKGRFTTYKVYLKHCLRLVKLFKLESLLKKFEKMDLLSLDEEEQQSTKPLDGTDIFCEYIFNNFLNH